MAVKPFLLLGAILPAASPTHGLTVSHGLASESMPFASVSECSGRHKSVSHHTQLVGRCLITESVRHLLTFSTSTGLALVATVPVYFI